MSGTTENTLVAFHTSGGGGNRTKTEFIGQDKSIQEFTDHLFSAYENESEVLQKIEDKFEGNESFEVDDVRNLITDQNFSKLEELYEIKQSDLGILGYVDNSGNWMGISQDDETGQLDEDGFYDTTTVIYLKDCSDDELNKILKSDCYVSQDVTDYITEKLGIEENC